MMGSNEVGDVWKIFVFPPFPPSICFLFRHFLSFTHTHTHKCSLWHHRFLSQSHTHTYTCIHKYSYTSRNRGSNSLTESLSPHVDNVTFSVFHYLVLTIREHFSLLSSLSVYLPLSLLSLFWDQWDVWEELSFRIIAIATIMVLHCNFSITSGEGREFMIH